MTVRIDRTAPSISLAKYDLSSSTQLVIDITATSDARTCTSNLGSVSGTGTSQRVTATSLSPDTSYSFTITCEDDVRNSNTVSQEYRTSGVNGGAGASSGSSSGGGSAATGAATAASSGAAAEGAGESAGAAGGSGGGAGGAGGAGAGAGGAQGTAAGRGGAGGRALVGQAFAVGSLKINAFLQKAASLAKSASLTAVKSANNMYQKAIQSQMFSSTGLVLAVAIFILIMGLNELRIYTFQKKEQNDPSFQEKNTLKSGQLPPLLPLNPPK